MKTSPPPASGLGAVIGLNLCPFAKGVHVKKQVRYVVSEATDSEMLLTDLERELHYLAEVSPEVIDTTLLIHPYMLGHFDDFTDPPAAINRPGNPFSRCRRHCGAGCCRP
jgi:hypothetical protein